MAASGSESPKSDESVSFEEMFVTFAKFGDSKNAGDAITLSNSDKWFKQAKVIDGKKITTTDTGIYFKQVAKVKKTLNLNEYNQFLENIARNKKMDVADIKKKLSSCGSPGTSLKSTPTSSGTVVSRLTDHSKFTGSHKSRFDDSGKGKGKEGRQDLVDGSGYVHGYKHAGTYDTSH